MCKPIRRLPLWQLAYYPNVIIHTMRPRRQRNLICSATCSHHSLYFIIGNNCCFNGTLVRLGTLLSQSRERERERGGGVEGGRGERGMGDKYEIIKDVCEGMSCTLPKKTDIKLNTLKCSYNRLLVTIDRPFTLGLPLMCVPGPPSACLLANYFMGLIN